MNEQTLTIEANTGDDKLTTGVAMVHLFGKNEKLMRAGKKLGLFWLIAVFCVFLPVVHFFLVPGFFLIGLFMFYRVMQTDGEVLSGKIPCPLCGKEVELGREFLNWPLKEICQGCVRVLRIRPVEGGNAPTPSAK